MPDGLEEIIETIIPTPEVEVHTEVPEVHAVPETPGQTSPEPPKEADKHDDPTPEVKDGGTHTQQESITPSTVTPGATIATSAADAVTKLFRQKSGPPFLKRLRRPPTGV